MRPSAGGRLRATTLTLGVVSNDARRLARFGQYLAAETTVRSPRDLTRPKLEAYLARIAVELPAVERDGTLSTRRGVAQLVERQAWNAEVARCIGLARQTADQSLPALPTLEPWALELPVDHACLKLFMEMSNLMRPAGYSG